jgi:hypothetical protein
MELRTPHLLDARALIHRKRRLTSAGRALRFGDAQRDDCFGPTDYGDLRTGIGHKHRSLPIDQTRSAIRCESADHSTVNSLSEAVDHPR